MANKATTDGVDFQRRLYYYIIGIVHRKYEYSALYEGDDKSYGALDDVILKIGHNGKGEYNDGLYFFQAKQTKDVTTTFSIQDVLHYKVDLKKYINSYTTYTRSKAYQRDGTPTEMIYWTTNDFHATAKKFTDEHISIEPHMMLTIDCIKKYRIKHWKALFMFDLAEKLASDSKQKSRNNTKLFAYLNESVADAIAGEILERVEQPADLEPKVRFREQFLQGASCLSENAKHFRFSFVIACEMLYTNPICPTFDITSLASITFSTDAFNMERLNSSNVSPAECSFQYNGLDEQMLDWFFEHFIFYTQVPKYEPMENAIEALFNEKFDKINKMFGRYLIDEPVKRSQQLKQDCFITKSSTNSVLKMIELKSKLVVQQPKGIEFEKERLDEFHTKIVSCLNGNLNELTVMSKTKVEWTATRIAKKFENSLTVSNETDFTLLLEALMNIKTTPFGECLISGEAEFILLQNFPYIARYSKQIAEQLEQKVKVIAIVSEQPPSHTLPNFDVVDEVKMSDVIVDYEELELQCISFDDKKLPFANFITKEAIDSVKKIEELSALTDITVKSDVFRFGEQYYVDRDLLGEDEKGKEKKVTHADLLSRTTRAVSIICDTAGQGKTTELIRIAKAAQNVDEMICLYIRAKTIAKHNRLSLVGLQLLQKLLYITPRSAFVEEIVQQTLEKVQVCLLVDGFDEVVEQYQNDIIKFLQNVLQHVPRCFSIIATRHESLPVLKKAFKNVANYKLASFPYEKYFQQLWLSEPNVITPELKENVQIFISNFDKLLKGTGCKTFLEVPQLCKIMGTIYQDRIRKPNIQWHTNYEIGSIYDTFVKSQLENTLRGEFDETKKLHAWATSLIKGEYYTKHAQLAYELEYNCYSNIEQYEQLQRFGLIMIQFDSSKSVNFMHRTVMDYFLVRTCMLDNIEKKEFSYFLKRYLCVSRANIADKFIDFFLADTQCLSTLKKDIITSYLASGANNILPTLIRMTLNNATFNTLRMLLSVAPISLLKPLCFRFGATNSVQGNNSSEINLKRLGERQTILLLDTLKICDDEYADAVDVDAGELSILERMLFEENPNEEDTMEVAIRKPFPDVFDWVVRYCKEHFNERVQRYLIERIPRYAQVTIRHCYAENKEKIIDKLLELCKNSFPAESVRKWLQSFDLLEELIGNIEIVPQGKQFKEVDRLDLTNKVLAMLDLYLAEETLITIKERSRERVETLQNEVIKCVLKNWINVER